ncbi:hypothetical protein D7V82_20930 [bacterium 1xD8-6]|nr:hypothetical protein D7V72_21510 [bacterium D16-36]RKI63156.1 hypothetical protein D7V82_20930 [bacterium 1xD8-6]
MRQYELAIRIAQVHHLVDERKYKKALAVIQTIDMRQVRSLSDLKAFAEVYTKTEQYEAAKATYLRIYRRSRTRRVLYRLIYLSIRTNALEDAEAYYQEFVRMNPSARDALILRYRIDKASGVPIGQLIEILQELKQEEYIEEWAYELAKLYHRAGRREECMEECQDILLWFGTGEIVERAKILIDHLQEKDPIPYYDDKDFTIPREEAPNPDDTGSLPNIKEFLKERKAEKKEEHRAGKNVHKAAESTQGFDDGYGGENITAKEKKEEVEPIDKEDKWGDEEDAKGFIDDYEEDDFGQEGLVLPQMAKDGIQKLSGFLKLGKKEEEKPAEKILNELIAEMPEKADRIEKRQNAAAEKEPKKRAEEKPEANVEKGEEKKPEKKVEKGQEKQPERKQEKQPKKTQEKRQDEKAEEKPENLSEVPVPKDKRQKVEYIPPHSQSGTGITQDLAKEISAIYEMEQQEQLREKAITVINETPDPVLSSPKVEAKVEGEIPDRVVGPVKRVPNRTAGKVERPVNIATSVVDRMTQAIQKSAGRNYIPLDVEEIQKEQEKDAEEQKDPLMKALDKEVEQYYEKRAREQDDIVREPDVSAIAEKVQKSETEILKDLLDEEIQDPEPAVQEKSEERAAAEPELEETGEELEIPEQMEPEKEEPHIPSEEEEKPESLEEELEAEGEEEKPENLEEELRAGREKKEEPKSSEEEQEIRKEEEEEEPDTPRRESGPEAEPVGAPLERYQAPDIPVVQTDYMEMPEITYEDLPTTRALQQSFQNVLRLIEGELDPSHFVLMGDGTDRIVGVSKQIIRIMKETGYLSQGRIAKINANQLNSMDLITFRGQLKGNCLLIENAADLLFPTITKIFSIMEEYYGDFVVILADEGTTLDQLFRFVPALARKFKYIIDISKYTKDDYQ